MDSAVLRGTTAASDSAVACCTSRRLPKWVSRRWRVCGPTPGMFEQFGVAVAHGAALAVVADGEAMALVADHLDEMQHGRAAVEDDGLVFVAVEVDDFFFFGDGGERLRGEAEGFEGSAAAWSWPRPPSMRMSEGMVVGSLADFPSGAKAPVFWSQLSARLKSCLDVRAAFEVGWDPLGLAASRMRR